MPGLPTGPWVWSSGTGNRPEEELAPARLQKESEAWPRASSRTLPNPIIPSEGSSIPSLPRIPRSGALPHPQALLGRCVALTPLLRLVPCQQSQSKLSPSV